MWRMDCSVKGCQGFQNLHIYMPKNIVSSVNSHSVKSCQGFPSKYMVMVKVKYTRTQEGPNTLCNRWAMLNRVLNAWVVRTIRVNYQKNWAVIDYKFCNKTTQNKLNDWKFELQTNVQPEYIPYTRPKAAPAHFSEWGQCCPVDLQVSRNVLSQETVNYWQTLNHKQNSFRWLRNIAQ